MPTKIAPQESSLTLGFLLKGYKFGLEIAKMFNNEIHRCYLMEITKQILTPQLFSKTSVFKQRVQEAAPPRKTAYEERASFLNPPYRGKPECVVHLL